CETPGRIDEKAIKKEIMQVLKASEQGWNDGDIAAYMHAYWQSDSLRFASGGTVSLGWQSVFERYSQRYPDKATMGHLSFSDLDIKVISSDAVMAFGRWQLLRDHDKPWGLFTLLLRKTSNGWRIVHDHTSSASN
ncbi:nuclear transport factor 2 family protein, partial [candidate division KSB1 bacterium]|nr:nuclear transport factor 2 family protein [candidate division KSB1 bacterium]